MSCGGVDEIDGMETNEKGYVSEKCRDLFFKKQRAKLENRMCFDCSARNSSWLSTSYAIYLCLNCSASHRRLGTHISFVRSVELDLFTKDQLRKMQNGGNGRARTFFKTHGFSDGKPVDYHSRSAQKYRTLLEKELSQLSFRPDSAGQVQSAPIDLLTDTDRVVSKTAPPQPSPNAPLHHFHGHHQTNIQPTIGSSNKPTAKKLEIDFDFDEAERECMAATLAPKPTSIAAPLNTSPDRQAKQRGMDLRETNPFTYPSPLKNGSPTTSDIGASVTRFSSAKGISSDDYFGRDRNVDARDQMAVSATMAKYSNASAISSAALFGPNETDSSKTLDDETSEQLAVFADKAREGVQKLTQSASNAFNKAQEWLNTTL